MDPNPKTDPHMKHDVGLEPSDLYACGTQDRRYVDPGLVEWLSNVEAEGEDDRDFSSASSSSISSLPSSAILHPPMPSLAVCLEDETDTVTGCGRNFTGLKIFSRR